MVLSVAFWNSEYIVSYTHVGFRSRNSSLSDNLEHGFHKENEVFLKDGMRVKQVIISQVLVSPPSRTQRVCRKCAQVQIISLCSRPSVGSCPHWDSALPWLDGRYTLLSRQGNIRLP